MIEVVAGSCVVAYRYRGRRPPAGDSRQGGLHPHNSGTPSLVAAWSRVEDSQPFSRFWDVLGSAHGER